LKREFNGICHVPFVFGALHKEHW